MLTMQRDLKAKRERWKWKKKIFKNLTYQLNQHNEYNKYHDHAVWGWHPAAE